MYCYTASTSYLTTIFKFVLWQLTRVFRVLAA